MKKIEVTEAWTGIADCMNCNIRRSVLFAGLEQEQFTKLHQPIEQRVYGPGEQIYRAGDEGTFLCTIRSGLVKLVQTLPTGHERIVRLLRGTDISGLEVLLGGEFEHDAIALQRTEICRLPLEDVKRLAQKDSQLFHELMARWHRALSNADRWITEFSTGSARQRAARLILWLNESAEEEEFELFSREDLGAVLGLTTETASRTVAEFRRQKLILESSQNIFTCDVPKLEQIIES